MTRTSEVVPLAEALAKHEDQELEPDQIMQVDGRAVNVHAVLERTVVVGPAELGEDDRRELVRHDRVLVEPEALRWRARGSAWRAWSIGAAQQRGRAAAARRVRERAAQTPA